MYKLIDKNYVTEIYRDYNRVFERYNEDSCRYMLVQMKLSYIFPLISYKISTCAIINVVEETIFIILKNWKLLREI